MVAELFPQSHVRELSLTRLSAEIARSAAGIGRIAVAGEVVRPQRRPSGRIYFTLRDRVTQVTVACPAANASRCRVIHGQRVRVTGSLGWVTHRGQLELCADEVVPVGEGAIAAAIADWRAELKAEGLLDRPRKPLPLLPTWVGVVCGAEAAVRADIESVVADRFGGYPVRFLETNVSGPGAASSLVQALQRLDRLPQVEVILLARGGGDAASLLPFSDLELCRAVARARAVVVSAVGHHQDRPLCDEVADARFGTPSIAAAAVIPDRLALTARLDGLVSGVAEVARRRLQASSDWLQRIIPEESAGAALERARSRLAETGTRLGPERVIALSERARRDLASVDWRSPAAALLAARQAELGSAGVLLEALDPARVLQRGYALVRGPSGRVLRDPASVAPGDLLSLTLAQGELQAVVANGARP